MKKWMGLLLIGALVGCSGEKIIDGVKQNKQEVEAKLIHIQKKEPIEVVFVGDIMMDWSVKTAMQSQGVHFPFQEVQQEIQTADLAIANVENAITTKGKAYEKQYTFRSDPESVQGLLKTGFDVVSLANNHTMDFGREGLIDTINHLNTQKLAYVGAGEDEQKAYAAFEQEINGKKVKILAVSRVLPDHYWFARENQPGIANAYEKEKVLDAIQKEKETADYVLVYIHWGVEKATQPEEYQRTFAKEMIEVGADAIIGSHPHVLQGFEFYQGKPIAYSLGNFLFPDYVKGKNAQTGILKVVIDEGQFHLRFEPYVIQNNQIVKKDNAYNQQQWDYLEDISYDVKIEQGKITQK